MKHEQVNHRKAYQAFDGPPIEIPDPLSIVDANTFYRGERKISIEDVRTEVDSWSHLNALLVSARMWR